ncbi:MAG: hypothetical protein JJU33_07320 [Phycisphaerales bacterium]|nr:hypothetical protein [Phycisphaerales bacterium]
MPKALSIHDDRLARARAVLSRVHGGGVPGRSSGAGPLEVGPGLHEWIGGGSAWGEGGTEPSSAGGGFAPIGVLIGVARARAGALGADARVLWIGRRVWPTPAALVHRPGRCGEDRSLLERSLFVDAHNAGEALWAADTALRSCGAGVIVADGSGLDMASTRRLQLAAEASGSGGAGVCLLARPSREIRSLSAAATRWLVEPDRSDEEDRPGWAVRLLRRKGLRPEEGHTRWVVRSCHATGDVRVVAVTADRPGPPARQCRARTGS